MSINPFNKNFAMIITVFVSDSDSNKEALQEEIIDEDEIVEREVDMHVLQRTVKSCCFSNNGLLITKITICQTIPLILIEIIRKNVH